VVSAVLGLVTGAVPATVPPPVARCTVTDPRLVELSGLAVVGDAVWAMADGGRRVELLRLDPGTCAVVDRRTAAIDPYDAEDLAAGPDGSLWVGDTGDNDRRRATVALIVLPREAPARLHRLTYPDGPHDAEALLVDARGVPTVVTKDVGATGIYQPEVPLTGVGPVPLVHVGDLVLPASSVTGGPIGGLGARTVTGGAVSADGRVVALRTYTDAWLFPVPDGRSDPVVAALRGTPVQVPLPGEPQGEAVAFTPDGTLLSASEARGGAAGQLRTVAGAAALAGAAPAAPATTPAATRDLAPTSADAPPAPALGPGVAPAAGPGAAPVDPAPAWSPTASAVVGTGVLAAALGALALAMARHSARRR
jgi:hypothetical protein